MKNYKGLSGWISATFEAPEPGTFGWRVGTAMARMQVRMFQRTGGRIGGKLDGAPVLILHHTGAKSGILRQTPAMELRDGDNYVIVASAGGAPKNPAWYHNLRANPDTEIDVRRVGRRKVRARQATADEVAALWPRLSENYRPFNAYAERTDRKLPVLILEPR